MNTSEDRLSLFVLRWKEPEVERPFRTPLYPLTPFGFCAASGWCLWSSTEYAGKLLILGAVPVLLGIGVYVWSNRVTK